MRAQTAAFGARNAIYLNQQNSEDDGGIFSVRPGTKEYPIRAYDQSTDEGTLNNALILSQSTSKKKLDDLVLSQAAAFNNRSRSIDKNQT